MDYSNIAIAACTVIGTVLSISKMLGKKFDAIDKRFDKIDEKFDRIDQRFEKIDVRLNSIDQRLSRLEGSFEERGHWEGKMYNMHKEEK